MGHLFVDGGNMTKPMEPNLNLKKDEGKPMTGRCYEVSTTCWEFNFLDYHKVKNILLGWSCCSIYAKPSDSSFKCCKGLYNM